MASDSATLRHCSSCGAAIAEDAAFCDACGSRRLPRTPPPSEGSGASPGRAIPPAVSGDAPEVPSIASAARLCWQRSAGLAVVWVPVFVLAALAISTPQLSASSTYETLLFLFVPLLLYTAVPVATCFTLGVTGYAGANSGMAGWRRGLRTSPTALVLLIVVGSGETLVMFIPLVGWAASLIAIPVMLLAYPMFAFEDVGVFSVWRRLWHLLGRAREQSGAIATLILLLTVFVSILFIAGALLITAFLLSWSIMDASAFGAPAGEPTGVWRLRALAAGLVLCLVLLLAWTTITLAWSTQVYERIRDMDVGDRSHMRPIDPRSAIGV